MNYKVIKNKSQIPFEDIHMEAFHGFFLCSLGKRFLKTYYHAVLNSNETIAVYAIDDNDIIRGFGTGCIHSKGFHKRLLYKNFFTFGYQAIFILFKSPKAFMRLLLNLDKISNENDDGNYAELISLGVSKESKGHGVGRKLVELFEEESKNRGCKKVALTTDLYNNDEVLAFYKRSGYIVFYKFTAYPNRKMYKLIKEF